MRIMGLDLGEKRIGIAFSDPMGWTAQGHSILQRKGLKKDLSYLQELCQEFQVEKIVLGLPLNMNGTMGPKALETQEFARALQEALKIPVDFWDERLSSKSAERVLLEADLSRKRRKELIDKIAAVHILQAYLDGGSLGKDY
ncbi:Holliday junction resolvase RuvX [Syntrophomonas wolfei]|uniref:Putative pre-16S rRNA nuclease n=1 Tax=Syntrophomonas wolfei subsp. wolfei (strain DSM 2245B / Goettingen) TaxID=335541 RepID=YQGF_SYNWW|nr:Holliday junction resolvase RuvX [Syntrophomonas wolfei]Q0AZP9.1 RecName: Full=Putative pre-16S rRNA nuclease [Syntrophomonas wolfei subsp. wolfei str. Goettingen G311]ABI67805.1 Holliday junction resolvase YqgF [Syntrophomonas wolfei subsp. wolfei str. Goettingen G311]